jgi:hypothetical protein
VVAPATIAPRTIVVRSSLNAAFPTDGVGIYEEKNTGWIDSGYWNFINSTNSYAQWTLASKQAGSATMVLRYANGGAISRNMHLEMNDLDLGAVAFASTGTWATWDSVAVPVSLRAGLNTVVLTSMSADGGPNVDQFQFDLAGVTLVRDTASLDTLPDSNDSTDPVGIRHRAIHAPSSFSYLAQDGILFAPHAAVITLEVFDLRGHVLTRTSRHVPAGETRIPLPHANTTGLHLIVLSVDGVRVPARTVAAMP